MLESVSDLHLVCCLDESATYKSVVYLLSREPPAAIGFDAQRFANEGAAFLVPFAQNLLSADANALSILCAEKVPFHATVDGDAIVALPKTATAQLIARNDIYIRARALLASECKLAYIHPASITHIRKYIADPVIKITETPTLYSEKVLPYVNAFPAKRTAWISKIITREAEADDILLYADPSTAPSSVAVNDGFVVVPDSKWDRKTLSNLYLLVLAFGGSSIKSLRDLRRVHVPLLKRIQFEVERLVLDTYGIQPNSLRLFVHYQPTYYWFHVHVVNAQTEPTGGMAAGQAHLLDDIIDNLEINDQYYATKTLTYFLPGQHELVSHLKG
ncbi:HIT-like domain-containing protein [Chytriomyces sp. MP71]|nr:HIT-like domain-containing protein [Chytriomyces sp. MP71]